MAANEAWKDKALTGAVLALAELRAMEREVATCEERLRRIRPGSRLADKLMARRDRLEREAAELATNIRFAIQGEYVMSSVIPVPNAWWKD